jgi:signal transduction histidine kinase
VSEPVRLLAIVGPITLATAATALFARRIVARTRLAVTMVAIAGVASLVTVVDLVVLNHFMLIDPNDRAQVGLVAAYSLTAGVAAALVAGSSTTRAVTRLAGVAARLGQNDLEARAGELHASPELRQLGEALDRAAERIGALIETERRTEAARRDLMTSISHDLRTPLANLRAMVEAIDEGVVDDPQVVSRYAEEMLRSIATLVSMVDDLFELSQVDGAALRADVRSISVADAVEHALDLCRHDAGERGIRVDAELGSAHAVRCSAKLARVVHSLVDNAVRYTPPGGSVRVTAEAVDGALELTVRDSGAGLAPDQLRLAFQPFWRGESSRSSRGSGLGLTLAQRIVEALGGEIHASSVPAGGSAFRIVVPGGGPPAQADAEPSRIPSRSATFDRDPSVRWRSGRVRSTE